MRTYSHDLRERVVRACDQGVGSRRHLATLFDVSTAWIRRLRQRRRLTGRYAARPWNGGPKPKLDEAQRQRLLPLVRDDPSATLAELRQRLGAAVSLSTIHRALAAGKVTLQQKRAAPPNRTGPTSLPSGRPGGRPNSAWTPAVGSSSTRVAPTPV